MNPVVPRSKNVLFLDIDDVLIGEYPTVEVRREKLKELMPEHDYKPGRWNFSAEEFTAVSHFFDPKALTYLHRLIKKVQRVADLQIVVSSSWRIAGDLACVKGMLKKHEFSKHIVDKTPTHFEIEQSMEQNLISYEEYISKKFHEYCRGTEIAYWLDRNRNQWDNYVILDDFDFGLSRKHPKNFVHVSEELLTKNDCNDAYRILMDKSLRSNSN